MKHTNMDREQVSALADGHLHGDEEFAQVIGAVTADDELRGAWQTYHLVGDVLRSGVHAPCGDTSLFLSRFQERLAAEPLPRPVAEALDPQPVSHVRGKAANEPVFRWKLVAGAASLAAAAAIGWNFVGVESAGVSGAQLAQVPSAPAAVVATASAPIKAQTLIPSRVAVGNGNPQVMLRDPRLDQLLEAHQQVGGASQLPSGFLRNATFERPSR